MQACTDPRGHKWVATSFRTKAGSQPVTCERCPATGYRLDPKVDQKPVHSKEGAI